jgi:membrane protein DedA with SNARE-associated domain/rhodanese-related sulfurtransferase
VDTLVAALEQHGYSILFAIVFAEAIGLPVPAALALLLAGGASMGGPLHPVTTVSVALAAMLLGDVLMYLLGRYTGWWLLGMLCRLSLNPESCIIRSADTFYKRGRTVLIFAKFVPGINTMAPPLAGSMNMRPLQFLGLDLIGAALYTGAFWGAGYLFSGFIGMIAGAYTRFGTILSVVIVLLVAGWLGYHAFLWVRSRNLSPVTRVTVAEIAKRLHAVALFDVRSHGYYEAGAMRIHGSSRLEPNALQQGAFTLPEDKEIVLYCTCYREATSERAARFLAGRGIKVSVIEGGFQAWKKAALPLEAVPLSDIVLLPTFD